MYQLGIKEENELLICYRGMYIPVNLCDFLKIIDYSHRRWQLNPHIYIHERNQVTKTCTRTTATCNDKCNVKSFIDQKASLSH